MVERFELFEDKNGKPRFRLVAPNNEIIAASQAYTRKEGALNGIESIKENAPKAEIMDLTGGEESAVGRPEHEPVFEIFKDNEDQHRFRLVAANGEIIAASEGYERKAGCENGIEAVKKYAPKADIEDKIKGNTIKDASEAEKKAKVKGNTIKDASEAEKEAKGGWAVAFGSGLIGAIIGYFVAVNVSSSTALLLAVITGALVSYWLAWMLLNLNKNRQVLSTASGIIGAFVGYVAAMYTSDPVGIMLAVICGGFLGFNIGWWKIAHRRKLPQRRHSITT